MKQLLAVVVGTVLLLSSAFSEEVLPTTDKEICPLNLSWEITYAELERNLIERGARFHSEAKHLGDGETYSYSFGIVDLVESGNYKNVPTEYYLIDIEKGTLHIGGYEVNRVVSNFYGDTNEMYLASFDLNTITRDGSTVVAEDMYCDLRNKLSLLYGTPIEKSWSGKGGLQGGRFVTNHCAWVGSNSTAVTLRWTNSVGTYYSGAFDGDVLEIEYGKINSNYIMKEYQHKIEQETRKKYQEAIEDIEDDCSGL